MGVIKYHDGSVWAEVAVTGKPGFIAQATPPADTSLLWLDTDDQPAGTNKVATTQSGTTYTVDAPDDDTLIIFTNASQVTVTLPTDASDNLRHGYRVALFAAGAGGVTLSTAGLTLKGSSPFVTVAQNQALFCEKVGADQWVVLGGTS